MLLGLFAGCLLSVWSDASAPISNPLVRILIRSFLCRSRFPWRKRKLAARELFKRITRKTWNPIGVFAQNSHNREATAQRASSTGEGCNALVIPALWSWIIWQFSAVRTVVLRSKSFERMLLGITWCYLVLRKEGDSRAFRGRKYTEVSTIGSAFSFTMNLLSDCKPLKWG